MMAMMVMIVIMMMMTMMMLLMMMMMGMVMLMLMPNTPRITPPQGEPHLFDRGVWEPYHRE